MPASSPLSCPVSQEADGTLSAQRRVTELYTRPEVQRDLMQRASLAADFQTRLNLERAARPALASELEMDLARAMALRDPMGRRELPRGAQVLLGTDDYRAFDGFRSSFPGAEIVDPLVALRREFL